MLCGIIMSHSHGLAPALLNFWAAGCNSALQGSGMWEILWIVWQLNVILIVFDEPVVVDLCCQVFSQLLKMGKDAVWKVQTEFALGIS